MKHAKSLLNRTLVTIVAALTVLSLASGQASADGTFSDDDGNPHESMIEAIAAAEITIGCAQGRYCPDDAVTRAQMATFLLRAFDLPLSDATDFDDIADSPHRSAIRALAAAEITLGCGNGRFCPSDPVTRAEMATFLARALGLSTDDRASRFTDDNGLIHEGAIESIAESGITNGCSTSAFCPLGAVTRAEMASFLGRAVGLKPIQPVASPIPVEGDVYVSVGDDLKGLMESNPEGTVFIIAAGKHALYESSPKSGQQFYGEPGAILTGNDQAEYAMSGGGSGVVVNGLVFEHYASPNSFGAINPGGENWTITNSEFRYNRAIGLKFSSGWIVRGNHIHHNGALGIAGYGTGALVENNEINHNNPNLAFDYGWEAGGTKFIGTTNLTVRANHVHDNFGPGLWADANNTGTIYEDNLVENNHGPGIFHEISNSATIRNNVVKGNAHKFYIGGILVANSGGDGLEIYGNTLSGNDGGIIALEDDRGGFTTKNVSVYDNDVSFSTGVNGLWSNVGSVAGRSSISFSRNSYSTSVSKPFTWDTGTKTWTEWQSIGMDTDGAFGN